MSWPGNAITIVVHLPAEFSAVTDIIRAISLHFPDAAIDTTRHDGWRIDLPSTNERTAMTTDEMPDTEEQLREIGRLREQLASAREENVLLSENYGTLDGRRGAAESARVRLVNDIELIAQALLEEAQERGWCSDYDVFVARLNRQMSDAHLRPCMARATFTWTVTVEVAASRSAMDDVRQELRAALVGIHEEMENDCDSIDVQVSP